jgi:hypothetical protein
MNALVMNGRSGETSIQIFLSTERKNDTLSPKKDKDRILLIRMIDYCLSCHKRFLIILNDFLKNQIIHSIKDPVTHFLWFYIINIMLK